MVLQATHRLRRAGNLASPKCLSDGLDVSTGHEAGKESSDQILRAGKRSLLPAGGGTTSLQGAACCSSALQRSSRPCGRGQGSREEGAGRQTLPCVSPFLCCHSPSCCKLGGRAQEKAGQARRSSRPCHIHRQHPQFLAPQQVLSDVIQLSRLRSTLRQDMEDTRSLLLASKRHNPRNISPRHHSTSPDVASPRGDEGVSDRSAGKTRAQEGSRRNCSSSLYRHVQFRTLHLSRCDWRPSLLYLARSAQRACPQDCRTATSIHQLGRHRCQLPLSQAPRPVFHPPSERRGSDERV
mmetsp:Transcript_3226/g.7789  ORF Transcript_3226/g.7789 Transcript_3226/m.7789 type:complete len:295 (+) Transcript_3226:2196-3080(+)